MEYVMLKNADLSVSRLCMGGCPMGAYGWGEVQEKELLDAVDAALDAGVNFFDTADTYGLGQSEKTLGKALSGKRDRAVIATKFGVRVENGKTFYDNSPAYLKTALENSLKRLGTDYIDVYQVHYRDDVTPMDVLIETLEECRQKGWIRYYGLSNIHEKDLADLRRFRGKFVSFQDEYSLACRKNEQDMRTLSEELAMTPLTWGSLGQGILTGKYDENTKFDENDRRSRAIYVNFHGEKLKQNMRIVAEMKRISEETGKQLPAIAVRFILQQLPESVVLTGIKRPSQLYANAEAASFTLSYEQMKRLNEVSA